MPFKDEILLTGSTGFIGAYIKTRLENEGYRVIGTTNRFNDTPTQIKIDIRKKEDLNKLPNQEFPIIIHTVGIVSNAQNSKLTNEVNIKGTQNILEWAKTHGCKHFIFTGSVAAYGLHMFGENIKEDTTKRTNGKFGVAAYLKSKARAEELIEQSGIPYTILRIPPVLGTGDTYITPTIVPQLLQGKLSFAGKKDRMYSLFYVKNIGGLMLQLIKKGRPLMGSYNCADYTVSWQQYCQAYAKELNVDMPIRPKSVASILTHLNDYHYILSILISAYGASYNCEKLFREIDWKPEFPWQEGIKEAINGFFASNPEYKPKMKKN